MIIGGEIESGVTVFIDGVSDDESFDFVEPEKKRPKMLHYRVEKFPIGMTLNDDGELMADPAPMQT
jgi:phage replication-related protein YjqB (UPF0714/DUF867 family)